MTRTSSGSHVDGDTPSPAGAVLTVIGSESQSLDKLPFLKALLDRTYRNTRPHTYESRLATWALRCVIAASATKALLHAIALAAGYPIAPATAPLPTVIHGLMFFGFALPALVLLTAGRRDRRAVYLGGFFIIVATAFAREAGRRLGADLTGPGWIPVRGLLVVNFDAFLPLLLWLFAAGFPRAARGSVASRVARFFIGVTATCGVVLAVLDGARHTSALPLGFLVMSTDIAVVGRSNAYWGITFALIGAALAMILFRSRRAVGSERVRATWLAASLFVGLAPVVGEVLLESLWSSFESWAQSAVVRPVMGALLILPCLTIPASASYALIFKPLLRLQLVLRGALRCSVTKYLFIVTCLTPIGGVAVRAYLDRDLTVSELLGDPVMRVMLALASTGVIGLVFTERILKQIDAAFFGPVYDAKTVLSALTSRLTRAADPTAVARMLAIEIRRTLSPVRVTIGVVQRGSVNRAHSCADQLPTESVLVDIAGTLRQTYLVVTDRLYRLVDRADASWLARTGAQLIVPLKSWDGTVLGLIGIAERDDDQPYTDEDCEFLSNAAAAAALALEKQRVRRERKRAVAQLDDRRAFECRRCGTVSSPDESSECTRCGEPLEVSCLPQCLNGKFRIERRLGHGGMGVVYLAVDMALNRCVAVKTLPFTSAAAAHRLRVEAQTMARLAHPNLAAVFGLETWSGRPLLVEEFLERGTLAARLMAARESVDRVLTWGIGLCDGLEYLHQRGLLHGDIKPSNIGFDASDTAKFLDFGLTGAFDSVGALKRDDEVEGPRWGTRQYACPESVSMPSCRQFDLWSLALVLYEALAAQYAPISDAARPPLANLREYSADVPEELADVFRNALHREFDRRPRSALELSLWLNGARPV